MIQRENYKKLENKFGKYNLFIFSVNQNLFHMW